MTAPLTPKRLQRIPEFEGLRGLLAWWVVASHIVNFSGYFEMERYIPFLKDPAAAVAVFIILSGFVIANLLATGEPYLRFITRRFFRLFPLFIVCFTASVAIELRFQTSFISPATFANDANYRYWHCLAHLSMLHGLVPMQLLPGSATAFLPPAWSISLEWQFYLLAPLICSFVARGTIFPILTVLALVSLRMASHLHWLGTFDMNAFLPLALERFLVGIFSFHVLKASQDFLAISSRSIGWALFSIPTVIFLLPGQTALGIWCFILLLAIDGYRTGRTLPGKLITSAFLSKPAQQFGAISYSIYLAHWPILVMVDTGIQRFLNPKSPREHFLFLAAASPFVIYTAALLLNRWIEKPGVRLGQSILSRLEIRPHASLEYTA